MKAKNCLIIAAVTLSLMSLELLYTRIFSAAYYYTFTFLVLSFAVLGLGVGALVHHLFPAIASGKRIGGLLSLMSLAGLISPLLIILLDLEISRLFSSPADFAKFIVFIILLGFPFLLGGVILARLFRDNFEWMPRLYMCDLVGAGLGVVVALLLMNLLGTPKAVFLATAPLIAAAIAVSPGKAKIVPLGLVLLLLLLLAGANVFYHVLRKESYPVKYERWDATSKITVYEGTKNIYGLNIDNASNSPVYRFDGDWNSPYVQSLKYAVDVGHLVERFKACTFLSLGAGGGMDVMQALQRGAAEVHAVEVNPAVNELMRSGYLARFTGYIYQDPRVRVVTGDARNYVRTFQNRFDLIYSYSSNSYAAMASGAFALAENYLFTCEAFIDYWRALSNDGFLVMEHRHYMPRIVSTVMAAMTSLGVHDPRQHLAVYYMPSLKSSILLLSKQPMDDALLAHAVNGPETPHFEETQRLFPLQEGGHDNLIHRIIVRGWKTSAGRASINIEPLYDDKPFIAQTGLWKNFHWNKVRHLTADEFHGFPVSRVIVLMILGRHGGGWVMMTHHGQVAEKMYGREPDVAHQKDFVECIKTRRRPNGDPVTLEAGMALVHLANIAHRTGNRKLLYDAPSMRFEACSEANRLVRRRYRKDFEVRDIHK